MKASEFKKMIKEAVSEVFQEQMKEILLEAIKTPKSPIMENTQHITSPTPGLSAIDKKKMLDNILGETALSFTTQDVAVPFTPPSNIDVVNGSLPSGDVSLDQIMGIMSK